MQNQGQQKLIKRVIQFSLTKKKKKDFHGSLLEAEETLKFDLNFKPVEDKVQGNETKKRLFNLFRSRSDLVYSAFTGNLS